jgi:hypothetical protein
VLDDEPARPVGRVLRDRRVGAALVQSVGLSLACVITYLLITQVVVRVHSQSRTDTLLGALWSVVATIFVYRTSHQETIKAATSRVVATLGSFVLCLIYLLILPFHAWAMALLVGIGTLAMMLAGRPDDVVTTGVTTAVVMIMAAITPHNAWQVPILRLFDTVAGTAVGLAASWVVVRLAPSWRPDPVRATDR